EQPARLDGAAAEGDHARRAALARVADEARLDLAERRLALLGEEVPDRALGPLDLVVDVDEAAAQPLGHDRPQRRLARAHEADQREVAAERVQRHGAEMRSRYACAAASMSTSASPPSFSRAARASSHATAASATTASASTACTSLRSTSAWAGSPVARSTESSGRIRVGSGFIAARTTIGSPFDTPASMPPARFERRTSPGSISSWACDPRRRASAKP